MTRSLLFALLVVTSACARAPEPTAPPPPAPAPAPRDLSGLYSAKADNDTEWMLVKNEAGALSGTYAGSMRIEGSVTYYQTPMVDLRVTPDGAVSFSTGAYDLYERPLKPGDPKPATDIGFSNQPAKHEGRVVGETIEITCDTTKRDDCLAGKLVFARAPPPATP